MSREKLTTDAVEAFVASHTGWARVRRGEQDALVRAYAFDDYASGIAFVVRVGFGAEARDHHPDLQVGWRKVEVAWSTHDAGGITALDAEMAAWTDAAAHSHGGR